MLFLRAEPHHVLDAGAVVPAPIEDDDLASGREMLQVALQVHLGLLPVGGGRQGDDPEHARTETLGDRANRAPFSCPVTSLEHDDDAQALLLDPPLQMAQPHLQLPQFLLVLRSFHRSAILWLSAIARRPLLAALSLPVVSADFRHVVEPAGLS